MISTKYTKNELEDLWQISLLCSDCSKVEDLEKAIEKLKWLVPFESFTLGIFRFDYSYQLQGFDPVALFEGNPMLELWKKEYLQQGYEEVDPTVIRWREEFTQGEIKTHWWRDTYRKYKGRKSTLEFKKRAYSFGIIDGYTSGRVISPFSGSFFSFFGPLLKKSVKEHQILRDLSGHLTHAIQRLPCGPLQLLNKRETFLFQLIKEGLSYDEIAENQKISKHTVDKNVRKIKEKLGVNSKNDLINFKFIKYPTSHTRLLEEGEEQKTIRQ